MTNANATPAHVIIIAVGSFFFFLLVVRFARLAMALPPGDVDCLLQSTIQSSVALP